MPSLDFEGLPEYETTSEEEEDPAQEENQDIPNEGSDDYERNLEYVEQYYQKIEAVAKKDNN